MISKDIKDINTVNNFENIARTKKSFSFYQNLEYVKNSLDGSIIYINNTMYNSKRRSKYIIELILKAHLTTIKGYYQGVSYYLNYKYNIPICLNKELILIQSGSIKEYDTFWINYAKVKIISNNTIHFHSGNKLKYNNSDSYWVNQIKKVNKIISLIEQLNK